MTKFERLPPDLCGTFDLHKLKLHRREFGLEGLRFVGFLGLGSKVRTVRFQDLQFGLRWGVSRLHISR